MFEYYLLALSLLVLLLHLSHPKFAWLAALAAILSGLVVNQRIELSSWWLLVVVALVLVLALPPIRRHVVSRFLLKPFGAILPRMGETERIALEAGTVWWDGELFSGKPNWRQLFDFEPKPISEREQAFIDGPLEDLCRAIDDWQVIQQRDLPEDIWERIKKAGLFGMIVPQQYGGLEFSAQAQSKIVTRLSSRSITAAVTVMVPNSLGPAELLLHYGTEKQKDYYLPRLASGEEIPCFALTGPEAGSDAAATQSMGVVCRGMWQGEEVLGMRLNWRKRYITLAPVATLVGLAFRLTDPDHLLGDETDLGITCALIPRDVEGIEIGQRHDPMGIPFHNGPTVGRDVFVPLDTIIGGPDRAGDGWRMLMQSLAAGRSISLPALSVGAAQQATRVVGAYGTIREQFDTPIGRFEGIEEPLARIGGLTYTMNAARWLTCGALDDGHKPSVVSAIVKAYLTQGMREVLTDAMDIRAGAGIQRGPRNILSRAYCAVPIGITVEGANILTRSMIIYGQGAMRCHPYVHRLISSTADRDVKAFDQALFGYLGFVVVNAVRSLLLGLGAWVFEDPVIDGRGRSYVKKLSRLSANFALASDLASLTYGGALKRRERVSGRLADCLAWMYLASASLRRFQADGQPDAHLPLMLHAVQNATYQVSEALHELVRNLPASIRWLARLLIFPLGRAMSAPDDRTIAKVARSLLEDRQARVDLTQEIYLPDADEPGLGAMEAALDAAVQAIPVETKLRDAVRSGRLDRGPGQYLAVNGLAAGIIDQAEYELLETAEACRNEVIQVDAFDANVYKDLR